MSTITYRPAVRDGAARILWAEAALLDQCADIITDTHMTADEAGKYLRELAIAYRIAGDEAAKGNDEMPA